MTTLIAYHAETQDIALFISEGDYWIGSYGPQMSHQNGEPPYYLISGYYTTEAAGLDALKKTHKDAF